MTTQLWRHKEKGGLYHFRLQRETRFDLVEGERVIVDLRDGILLGNVLVTDDVKAGTQFTLYTDAHDPTRHYLRPSVMWNDGRFVLEPEEAPMPNQSKYGDKSDALLSRIIALVVTRKRRTYWLTPAEQHLLDMRWDDKLLIREGASPVLAPILGSRVIAIHFAVMSQVYEAQFRVSPASCDGVNPEEA